MKSIFMVLLLSLSMGAFSQEILLHQDVKSDSIRPTRSPNLKNFTYGYLGLGFPLYTNESDNYTKPGVSSAFDFGVRYKRKFTNFLALGLALGMNATAFKIKQGASKTVPDTVNNDKEKFQVNSLPGSAFLRFNVGRRGNYIGNYLDLGAYGSWNFGKKHKTTNKNAQGEKVKVLTSKLTYVEDFSYGVLARIGAGRYALTAAYRLSDIFTSSSLMPELPRLSLGIEVGLFR